MKKFYFIFILTQIIALPLPLLGKATPLQLQQFEETLTYGIPSSRKAALNQIKTLKDQKTYPLIQKVIENDQDPDVLLEAVRLAGDFEIKEASAGILKILEETKNNPLKATCYRALGKLVFQEASKLALEDVEHENAEIKQAAIFYLGEIKEKKALESLYETLEKLEEKEDVLQEAVQSIGKIGDKSSIEKLKEVLENTGYSKFVRMYAPIALAKIGGKEVTEILNQAVQDPEYFIRIRAIYAISQLEGADISSLSKALQNALKDQDMNIRLTAIDAVTTSKDQSYLDFIKYLMEKDPEFKVRQKAFLCYAKLEDLSKVNSFYKEKLLERGHFQYKRLILDAIKEAEIKDYTSLLDQAFFEKDLGDLRQAILRLLGEKIADDSAFNLVVKIANSANLKGFGDTVKNLRTMALQGIAKRGWEKAFPVYKNIAQNPKDPLHISALQLITGLNKKEAQSYFKSLLSSNINNQSAAFKHQVIKSLGQLQPEGIEGDLKSFYMHEPDSSIRMALERLLRAYGYDSKELEKEYKESLRKPSTPAQNKESQQEGF